MIRAQLFLYLFFIYSSVSIFAHDSCDEGYFVFDKTQQFLKIFRDQDLIVDHLGENGYEVYGPKGLGIFLESLNLEAVILDDEKGLESNYPAPEEIERELKEFVSKNTDILSFEVIGQSLQKRNLFVIKISDNVQEDEQEPEFKYIANMHGNEIVGRDMMVLFIKDLVKRYRSGDREIQELVDGTEIFILPSMNPDGAARKRRGNGRSKDLNRNFPDFTTRDNQNNLGGREPETRAVMKWQAKRHISLSANFHGGAKVVNYPWDTQGEAHPFEEMVLDFSLLYASTVSGMHDNRRFSRGVINGHDWYEIKGGMQDWSYYWHNDLQVTIELSNSKWPNYNQIPNFYNDNREALISYLKKVHQGVRLYFDDRALSGTVVIHDSNGISLGEYSLFGGEFHKVLPVGEYSLEVTFSDGSSQSFSQKVQ